MTVQDITRLIVLPVIYTESKRCGANRTFLISFLAELSILHCNHSFFVFCFSDSGHSQPQVQSALLDRAYRERNNSGRTSGAAFHLSMLWDRRYGLPLPRWIERHDCARQWAGRYFLDLAQTVLILKDEKDSLLQVIESFVTSWYSDRFQEQYQFCFFFCHVYFHPCMNRKLT